MNWIEMLGIAAACCTTFAFLPQAVKTIRHKDTKAISGIMYTVFTLGTLLWLTYGIMIDNLPVILANVVTFVLASIILVYKFKYK